MRSAIASQIYPRGRATRCISPRSSRFNVPFRINTGVGGSNGPEAQEGVFVGGDVGGSGGADEYPGGKGERAQARAGGDGNDDFPAVRTARPGEGDVAGEGD